MEAEWRLALKLIRVLARRKRGCRIHVVGAAILKSDVTDFDERVLILSELINLP